MAAGYFRGLAEAAGVEFVDPLPDLDFRAAIADPVIWDRYRGTKVVLEKMGRPLLEGLHTAIVARHEPGQTVVVASSLAFGARVAEETHAIPLVSVHLSPALFRSEHDSPRLPAGLGVSGRVDRLLVTPDRVLVVDYKTNRPAPARIEDADFAYRVQMALYAAVLAEIFPGRRIEAALVWTDGPRLMPVPENMIARTLDQLAASH
jgi:hypothetical protein